MKTILYFLSFSTLYIEREAALTKLDQVLHIFEQNSDRIRLLWYQDPLFENNARLLPENIRNAYEEQVSRLGGKEYARICRVSEEELLQTDHAYKTPGLSPEEAAAVDECDAYYGDPGYLCLWFKRANKPVMIQNIDLISE